MVAPLTRSFIFLLMVAMMYFVLRFSFNLGNLGLRVGSLLLNNANV